LIWLLEVELDCKDVVIDDLFMNEGVDEVWVLISCEFLER